MKQIIQIIFLFIVSISLSSCNKEEGKGGRASIEGNIQTSFYCAENGEFVSKTGGIGERVYISYGDNSSYDDDTRAGSNGYYKFDYLNKGTYRITVISECDTCASGMMEVSKTIDLEKKDEAVLEDLNINDYSNGACSGAGSGGMATATGSLEAIFIDNNNLDTLGTSALMDERVYLIYGDGKLHSDDERSSSDGSFQFTELRAGKYRVFAYSECLSCIEKITPVYQDFEIAEGELNVTIPKISVVDYK
ncbi:MAG: hypothetical protein ACPGD5_09355 [Salibacteraceae bacterium]